MASVYIIDDERTVREALQRYIAWDELGVERVKTFSGAEQAKEELIQNPPEIIISDIRMPRMDGIQLAQYIREHSIPSSVVFISAYSDIEYYRQAMKLDVTAYVEKPIHMDELTEILRKLLSEITSRQDREEQVALAGEVLDISARYVEETFIRDLTRGKWNAQLLPLISRKGTVVNRNGYFLCVILEQKDGGELDEDVYLNQAAILLRGWFDRDRILLAEKYQRIRCIISSESFDRLEKAKQCMIRDFREKRENTSGWFAALSAVNHSWRQIEASYQQAVSLMNMRFFTGYGQAVDHVEDIAPDEDEYTRQIRGISTSFAGAVREGSLKQAEAQVRMLRELVMKDRMANPDAVRGLFFNLYQILRQRDWSPGNSAASEEEPEWNSLIYLNTLDECCDYLTRSLKRYFADEAQYLSDNRIVDSVLKYVQRHYKDSSLSVMDVSEAINISTQYMTRVFREQTGITVGQYIRDQRLEYSCTLLKDTSLSLGEIAEKAGYANESYWGKVFRKQYGMQPSEYRRWLEDYEKSRASSGTDTNH